MFRDATAVEPSSGGSGYDARILDGWDIAGNTNGGYLLSIVGRALCDATGRPDPVSVTAHYLAPGSPSPVNIDARVLKQGKRFATASATLSSPDRPLLAVVGTFGELAEPGERAATTLHVDGAPPELPPPDECVALVDPENTPPFMQRIDLRLHPADAGFRSGEPSGTPRVRGWFRLHDEEPVDTIALLCAVDAFPPTAFNARLPVAWTPTLELTAHVRSRPAHGWLACSFSTRFVTGGFLEADGEVWDSTGTLVAQSRQLALVPRG